MNYEDARALWKSFHIASEIDLEYRLDSFRILFAYHSGRIENEDITYHDTRDIFENGRVSGFTGSPRALMESQNQKLCYEFLKGRIVSKEPLSEELILETHRMLTAGTYDEQRYVVRGERPGSYKIHDYVTGILEVGSQPEDVAQDMASLLQEVNSYSGDQPLTAAAYLHARFESIHPFADGNGRVGRTIMNYYLMTHNEPPLIIFEDDRKDYYLSLEAYDRDEDLQPLKSFMERETIRTWEKTACRASGKQKKAHKGLDEQ